MTRELPTAITFERSLLGGILVWPNIFATVSHLQPTDFSDGRHTATFAAIRDLDSAKQPIGLLTVEDRLKKCQLFEPRTTGAFLSSLVAEADGPSLALNSARLIREKALCRRVLEAADAIAAAAYSGVEARELVEMAQARIFALSADSSPRKRTDMRGLLKASTEAYNQRANARAEGRAVGIPSGLRDVDALLGGFQPGHQVVIAARPGMGKSAFMLDMLKSAALAGHSALAFSLEMPELELADRLICGEARIDSHTYRAGALDRVGLGSLVTAFERLKAITNFEVDDTPQLRISDIRSRVRKWRSETGTQKPGAIAVDYLQLVAPEGSTRGNNREREVAEISRGLKAIAKESGCVVFALAQVGRECEKRENKRPMLSDLRESGAIEADADVVLFLYRDDYYDPKKEPGVAETIIAKHRGGRDGTVKLRFDAPSTTFSDLRQEVQRW